MAEPEPTPWELMRTMVAMRETLERMDGRMMSKDMFEAHQIAVAQRFTTVERQQTEWTTESRGEHVALGARIDKVKEKQDEFQERLRTDRQKWALTGVSAAGGLVVSVVVAVFTFFLNGGA